MSEKDRPLSELSEEEYQETLREISERLGLKMLPEDHPIYQEPPTVIFNPFPKKTLRKRKMTNRIRNNRFLLWLNSSRSQTGRS